MGFVELLAGDDGGQLGRGELEVKGDQPIEECCGDIRLAPMRWPADDVFNLHVSEYRIGLQHGGEHGLQPLMLGALGGAAILQAVNVAGVLADGAPFAVVRHSRVMREKGVSSVSAFGIVRA